MPRTRPLGTKARRPARRGGSGAKARPAAADPLLAAMRGATRTKVGGVRIEAGRAGGARVRRVTYPAGFRWSADMKPSVGTDLCMHAHVGFIAKGEIRIRYADGCLARFRAPQVVAIDPGHDGWVVGDGPAVLIEIDFERETVSRLGMASSHRHA